MALDIHSIGQRSNYLQLCNDCKEGGRTMNLEIANVNVLIHGLFFMTLNKVTTNLEILVPNIPDHHFVVGLRGSRVITSGTVDLTDPAIGLKGGTPTQSPNGIPADIPGSIFQFTKAETGIGDFSKDPAKFLGRIILPWPAKFFCLRCDDIKSTFLYDPSSLVGSRIELNARLKNSTVLGIVPCLQYTRATVAALPWASSFNLHFYLQPTSPHDINAVNTDLSLAASCFMNPKQFDLKMLTGGPPVLPVQKISANTKRMVDPHEGGVSPANCPNFYVG